MRSADIRQSFVDFFHSRGHEPVRSASLVPADDPTLLFTNAGMVQFKRVFQGLERRAYRRAVTVQKCVRAGGKHNDLEQVGHTARHHTFFEMLGNFSFGDYFKKDAIAFGWEWVTGERYLHIHPDRIYVSVHHQDDEARRLWREGTGIADQRIYGLGDKDNFWQMGDTGPCGPCSEIYVDLRGKGEGGTGKGDAPTLEEFIELNEAGRLLEIWNLVFMQFDQAPDGSRTPLPAPSVDTGAGLERIAAIMQGVDSNFDTDLFAPIIRRAAQAIGRAQHIASVTRAEEERFLGTIEGGLERLDQIMTGSRGTVSSEDTFKLYDTYGFPVDLTQVIAAERGWRVGGAGGGGGAGRAGGGEEEPARPHR